MASLKSEFSVRPCFVNGEKALFHRWEEIKEVVAPSVMVGGHDGGEIQYILANVEYEDGQVAEVTPKEIRFVPGIMRNYAFQ